MSLGSLIGFVTVIGIAARNAIMLISHYRHLNEVEGVQYGRELILRGAEERLQFIGRGGVERGFRKRAHQGPLPVSTCSLRDGRGATRCTIFAMASRATREPAGDLSGDGQAHGDEGVVEVALRPRR